jgi:hypothetical protein
MPRLAAVTLLALLSMSGPQTPQDEVAALRKEVETLKAQQAAMLRDLTAIKNFLQALAQAQQPAEAALVDKTVQVDGVPMKGAPTAKVMMSPTITARSAAVSGSRPSRRSTRSTSTPARSATPSSTTRSPSSTRMRSAPTKPRIAPANRANTGR